MEFRGKHTKPETQNGHTFITTTVDFFQKNIPVHKSKSKFCIWLFKNKIFKTLVEIIACPLCIAFK